MTFFDADGQHRVEDLEIITSAYEQGKYDLVIGSRFLDQPLHRFTIRSTVNKIFALLARFFAGVVVTDSTSGLKLISRKFIDVAIRLPAEDMHAELIIALIRNGARYKEVNIKANERVSGDSMYNST